MKKVDGARRSPWSDWGTWVVGGFAAFALVFIAWVFLHHSQTHADAISDIAFLPVTLAAALLAWRVARHPDLDRATRKAWGRMGAAFLCFWAGDCIWFFFEIIRRTQPSPSLADVFYLSFYGVLLWGLLTLPVGSRTRGEWHKLGLDATTVLVGATLVVWYLVVGPIVHRGGASAVDTLLNLAYPAGDLVLIFGAAVTLLRNPGRMITPALQVLLAAVGIFVVGDLVYARASLNETYRGGSLADAFWMLAQILLVVAAQRQWLSVRDRDRAVNARSTSDASNGVAPGEVTERLPRWLAPKVSRLPYLAMAVGYGLLISVGIREAAYPLGDLLLGSVVLTGLVVARQVTALRENVRLFGQLHELAVTDSLTGLRTRRSFADEAAACIQAGPDASMAIVMIDVDHFKSVNDSFGHAAGDAVLQEVARRCRVVLRTTDVLARYGGDELVAFLPRSDVVSAGAVAERIRVSVSGELVWTEQGAVAVSLSLGIAVASSTELEELLRRSDVALYDAKQAGRDCARMYTVAPDPSTTALRRVRQATPVTPTSAPIP